MLRVQLVQQTVMVCVFPSAVIPSRLLLPTAGTEHASNAAVLNVVLVLKGVKTQKPGKIERKNECSIMIIFVPCLAPRVSGVEKPIF